MKKNSIITISRQYGSGGRLIGKMIAEQLNIPFYDKEIIDVTAKESGFAPEYIERAEQTTTMSFLYNLAVNGYYSQPLTDQLFIAESNIIKRFASEGQCVIVGRCADYILRDYNCLNVYIHADEQSRAKRIQQEHGVAADKAIDILRKKDKGRKRHYKYYTEKNWGIAENYDLCLNSASVGIEKCAEFIAGIARREK